MSRRALAGLRLRLLVVTLYAGMSLPASAAELIVQGQVVDVVPLGPAVSATGRCGAPAPAGDAGLVALLRWDLDSRCPPTDQPPEAGYRVYYRWEGRTYSRVMAERPGSTVSLRVRLQ